MSAERKAAGQVRRHADLRHGRGAPDGPPAAGPAAARRGAVRRLCRAPQGEDGVGGAAGKHAGSINNSTSTMWNSEKWQSQSEFVVSLLYHIS